MRGRVERGVLVSLVMALLLLLSPLAIAANGSGPHWVSVEEKGHIVVVSIKPDKVLEDGTPVVFVNDKDEALLFFESGNILLDYAYQLAGVERGHTTRYTGLSYNGPGEILTARMASDGTLILLTEGEVDLEALKASIEGSSAKSVIIINVPFKSNVCATGNEEKQDAVLYNSFLAEVLGEVMCYPPIVVIDATKLRESGHSVDEVVDLLRSGLGFDNFYLFLVEDYFALAEEYGPEFLGPSVEGPSVSESQAGSPSSASSPSGDELRANEAGWGVEWAYVAIAGVGVGAFLATRFIKR